MPVKGFGKKILRLTEEDVNDHFVRDTFAKLAELSKKHKELKGEPETRAVLEEFVKIRESLDDYFENQRVEHRRILNS